MATTSSRGGSFCMWDEAERSISHITAMKARYFSMAATNNIMVLSHVKVSEHREAMVCGSNNSKSNRRHFTSDNGNCGKNGPRRPGYMDHSKEGRKVQTKEGEWRSLEMESGSRGSSKSNTRRRRSTLRLPCSTTREEKIVKHVCRVLEQGGHWTPYVDQALMALSPKLHNSILARILKHQTDPTLAWKLFKWAESQPLFVHDAHTFNSLIEVLGKAEDAQSILSLIKDMHEADIKVKAMPFTILISIYGKAGMAQDAETALNSMPEFNCEPNVYTYNAILYALLKANRTEAALFTYSRMLHQGCEPNQLTFTILICGLSQNNQADIAMCFLEEMRERGCCPDIRTYNSMIGHYLKSRCVDEALNMYKLALKNGCQPDTITYTMLLDYLLKIGRFEEAVNLFREMISSGCNFDVDSFKAFLCGMFQRNEVEMALSIFSCLVKIRRASVAIYNIVVEWFCQNKKLDQAIETLADMEQVGVKPDTWTYNSLISGSLMAGQPGMAIGFATRMIDEGCTPDVATFTAIIEFFLKNCEIDDALSLFREMMANGLQPDTETCDSLFVSLVEAGKSDLALSIAREMTQRGLQP